MNKEEIKMLLLHSVDGQHYMRTVIYPNGWTVKDATQKAIAAFTAAQTKDPREWSWDDYEPELLAMGFTLCNLVHGPVWDEQRVEDPT